MGLNNINSKSTWGQAASDINTNFTTIDSDLKKVKNATTRNKGYFSTSSELISAFPTASKGDIAYVGSSYPYDIWKWNGGSWAKSGSTGGEESVNLGNYYTKVETDEKFTEADAKLSELGSEVSSELGASLFSIKGKYIDYWGVINSTNNPNAITDYLPIDLIEENLVVKGRSTDRVLLYAFYDENKIFISGVGGVDKANVDIVVAKDDIPSNAKYIIINGYDDKTKNTLQGINLYSLRKEYMERIDEANSNIEMLRKRFDFVYVKNEGQKILELNAKDKYIKIYAGTSVFRPDSSVKNLGEDIVIDTSNITHSTFLLCNVNTLEFKAVATKDVSLTDLSDYGIIAAYSNYGTNGYLLFANSEKVNFNGGIIYSFVSEKRFSDIEEKIVDKRLLKVYPIVETNVRISEAVYDAYEEEYDTSLIYYIRNFANPESGSGKGIIIATANKETGEVVNNSYNTMYESNAIYKDGNFHVYRNGTFTIAINWDLVQTTDESWFGGCKAVFSESIANKNSGNYINVCSLLNEVGNLKYIQSLQYYFKDLTDTQQSGYWNGNATDGLAYYNSSATLVTVTTDIVEGDVITTNSEFRPTTAVPWPLLDKDNKIIQRLTNFKRLVITKEMIEQGAEKIGICYRTTEQIEPFVIGKERLLSLDLKKEVEELQEKIKNVTPKYGKKVLLFGDSQIGQCRMESILSEILNTDVYNFGFGGCRWTWRTSDGSNKWDAYTMVEVADALTTKDFTKMDSFTSESDIPSYFANAVAQMKTLELGDGSEYIATIAYGGNDYASGVSLGEVDSMDKTKLYGAINYAISTLLKAYPALTIHVVSPTYRVYEKDSEGTILVDSDEKTVTVDGEQLKRFEYGDKILNHARDYHRIPVYDMYRRGGRNRYNIYTVCPDGTHPTSALGRQLTAEKYEKILKSF